MGLPKRIVSFVKRVYWFRKLTPTIFHAVSYLIQIKLNQNKLGNAKYKNIPFTFRPKDMSAIREVLADQEYKFLKPFLYNIDIPVILDAGANIGMFSIWALGENPKAQILSLEASPDTYKIIEKNATLASERNLSWNCQNGAAWKNNDLLSFSAEGDSMGHKVLEDGTEKVRGTTLQELITTHLKNTGSSRIHLLKTDIEGAEEFFLENSTENKKALSHIDRLVIELHPDYCNTESVEQLIRESFNHIENQTDRISNKPLLYCYNDQ